MKETASSTVEDMYQRYGTQIYSFLYYRTGRNDLAQELTQTVFERVLRKYHTYNPRSGSQGVWLFTIARNILTDHFRYAGRHPVISIEDLESASLISSTAQPEESFLAQEQRLALTRALGKLSAREHMAVALKYGAELRNTEIAKVMRVTEKNAGVILCRALRKLNKELEKEL